MRILGIETSCDETSMAVVENGTAVLSVVIASQIDMHRETGGVVPEVAAREHALKIAPVLLRTLEAARKKGLSAGTSGDPLRGIDAIAVTRGPGLLSSLLMGNVGANALHLLTGKPIIPVQHIEGHLYANFLGRAGGQTPRFPALVLTASGGHNELILWKGHGEYRFLGETLDDAAGEAFDKVARLLGLPYPGGPEIEHIAREGDPTCYPLPRVFLEPWRPEKAGSKDLNWNFSFSGLKSAVNRLVQLRRPALKTQAQKKRFVGDVAASFQTSLIEVFTEKIYWGVRRFAPQEVHLTGGVSANKTLRSAIEKRLQDLPKPPRFRYPKELMYCTDNAAMIASAAYFRYKKGGLKATLQGKASLPDQNLKIAKW